MLRAFAFVLLLLAAAVPVGAAQAADPIDVRIELASGRDPSTTGGNGTVTFLNATPGERYAWTLNLTKDYTTFEIVSRGAVDLARARQLVPTLHLDENETVCQDTRTRGVCDYPLFEPFPNERIWDVDGPARVYFVNDTLSPLRLRLGVPGPTNATLVLTRDVSPPVFTLGPVTNLTRISFLQETRTDELARADLQVRKKGADEWVQNPTTVFHYIQRFPVQGLDADTEYEARVHFFDWAGNNVTSAPYSVRTPPAPDLPKPVITPLSPEPNGTLEATQVVIRASIDTKGQPLAEGGIRLFLDLKEVRESLVYEDGVLSYLPRTALHPGRHTVNVEATTEEGATGSARWTFEVAGAERNDSPGLPLFALVGALAAVAFARRFSR